MKRSIAGLALLLLVGCSAASRDGAERVSKTSGALVCDPGTEFYEVAASSTAYWIYAGTKGLPAPGSGTISMSLAADGTLTISGMLGNKTFTPGTRGYTVTATSIGYTATESTGWTGCSPIISNGEWAKITIGVDRVAGTAFVERSCNRKWHGPECTSHPPPVYLCHYVRTVTGTGTMVCDPPMPPDAGDPDGGVSDAGEPADASLPPDPDGGAPPASDAAPSSDGSHASPPSTPPAATTEPGDPSSPAPSSPTGTTNAASAATPAAASCMTSPGSGECLPSPLFLVLSAAFAIVRARRRRCAA